MDALLDRHDPIFALKHEFGQARNSCHSAVAQKREMREVLYMNLDEQDRERRRTALRTFYETHKPLGLKSVNRWAARSAVAEATLRQLLDGTRAKNMRADTYEKLLRGASELLNREVMISELLGVAEAELDERANALLRRLTPDQKAKAVALLESFVDPKSPGSKEGK